MPILAIFTIVEIHKIDLEASFSSAQKNYKE